jgi:hypothetical protein
MLLARRMISFLEVPFSLPSKRLARRQDSVSPLAYFHLLRRRDQLNSRKATTGAVFEKPSVGKDVAAGGDAYREVKVLLITLGRSTGGARDLRKAGEILLLSGLERQIMSPLFFL